MDEIYFSSLNELYKRIQPALKCKRRELKKSGYSYLKEIDIWNSLMKSKWQNESQLALCDIVDDILNTDPKIINDLYNKNKNEVELPKLKDNK